MLGEVIDPNYHGEIELSLHNGDEDYAWSAGDSVGGILVLPCPEININGTTMNLVKEG